MEFDDITESTDYYDITFYPVNAERLMDKAGITFKGKTDELARAITFWQTAMRSEVNKPKFFEGVQFKFTAVKNGNNGVGANIHASGGKANLMVWRACIHLTKIKGAPAEHLAQLAKELLIPLMWAAATGNLTEHGN